MMIRTAIIAEGDSSGWVRPAITSIKKELSEDIIIVYRKGDSVRVAISTNQGSEWNQGPSFSARSDERSNRIHVVGKSTVLHAVWDSQSPYALGSIHYASINLSAPPYSWISNYSSTLGDINGVNMNGREPQLVVDNDDGLHIVYITTKDEDIYRYDRIVHRRRDLSSGLWDSVDVIKRMTSEKETIYTPPGLQHCSVSYSPPATAVIGNLLVVGSGEENRQPKSPATCGGDLKHFGYTFCITDTTGRIPDTTGAKNGELTYRPWSNGEEQPHSFEQALAFKGDSLYMVFRRSEDSLWVVKSGDLMAAAIEMTIPGASLPMLSKNIMSDLILTMKCDSHLAGYRIPRPIDHDIDIITYITGKTEIKHDTTISIETDVVVSVYDTLILADSSSLAVSPGSRILIKPGGRIYIGPGASLNLQGGAIECEEGSDTSIIAYEPHAIRGKGALQRIRIWWSTHAVTDTTDTLAFIGGGNLAMQGSGNPDRKWWMGGTVTFEGSESPYQFAPGIDSIIVWNNALLTTIAGTRLSRLPNIAIYSPATVQGRGSASDSCIWDFRDNANLDNYGILLAGNTTFTNTPDSAFIGWNGILSAYGSSLLQLDSCTVEKIRVSPDTLSGAAVHLYEATNPENRIRYSRILRETEPGRAKIGDGIILQPGQNFSALALSCDTIRDAWWSGFTSVQSLFDAASTVIHSNRIGLVGQDLSDGYLTNVCVMHHDSEGVASRSSASTHLGRPYGTGYPVNGNDRIVGNEGPQLKILDGAGMFGGVHVDGIRRGGYNNIGHDDTTHVRIEMEDYSIVELRYNWWGLTPAPDSSSAYCALTPGQMSAIFQTGAGAMPAVNPVLCASILPQCATNCIWEPPGGGGSQGTQLLARQASGLGELEAFAQSGNFAEVYRYLGLLLSSPGMNAPRAFGAFSLALQLELAHARRFPDSAGMCARRFEICAQSVRTALSDAEMQAGMTHLLARSSFAFGDIFTAETYVSQLRASWPDSPQASSVLSLMQLIAMAKRDSAGMDAAISAMVSARYSSDELRVARSLRRGFLRVMPKALLPKHAMQDMGSRQRDVTHGGIGLKQYPNPVVSGSVVIEYTLPEESQVTVKVYSLLGDEVAEPVNERQQPGIHRIVYTLPSGLPAGMYIAVVATETGIHSMRMLVGK
jgi:hypothetical protein